MSYFRVLIGLVILAAGMPVAAAPQAGSPAPLSQASAQSPSDVRFELRLKDAKSRFYPGELIELELLFSSSMPKRYRACIFSGHRPGREESERYVLEPMEGVTDPMEDYYSQAHGYAGSRFGSCAPLEENPYRVVRYLNDSFRFDRPGHFRLFVVVSWVSEIPPQDEEVVSRPSIKIASNAVDFEILPPSPTWEANTLQSALLTLERSSDETERRFTCKVLRALGTLAAVAELVQRVGAAESANLCSFDLMAGLYGSPHRKLVIQATEQRLTAPDQHVSGTYVRTLARLVFLQEHPEPLPPYPGPNHPGLAEWNRKSQERQKQEGDTLRRYRDRLLAAFSQKRGVARAVTLNTLTELGFQGQAVAREMAAVFRDLPPGVQFSWLTARWRQIAGPAMLPALLDLYREPPSETYPFRDLALRRIYEVDPGEGRRLILAEIRSAEPHIGIEVLGLLPEEILPELDDLLATRLEEMRKKGWGVAGIHAALLERYGTTEVLPRIKVLVTADPPLQPEEMGAALLAYFLRTDPPYGAALAVQAPTAPCGTAYCRRSLLRDIARLHASPELEKVALALLNHPDRSVAADAVAMLGENGSAEAKTALWNRFEQWHENSKDRAAALRYRPEGYSFPAETDLERALLEALTHARAWILDADELRALEKLCLTRNCRLLAENSQQDRQRTWTVEEGDYVGTWWRVGPFMLHSIAALKEKLLQFPRGTVLLWRAGDLSRPGNEQLFLDLRSLLDMRGITLEKPSPSAN